MTIRDMVARHSDFDETQDLIPTPPWVTRALYEIVCPELKTLAPKLRAWEPAAGFGHMAKTMQEYTDIPVLATDKTVYVDKLLPGVIVDQFDFTKFTGRDADLIVTNPPYKLLGEFIELGLERTTRFLAVLVRVQALEGQTRYENVYAMRPPTTVAFFSDRISFKTGEVVRKAPKMFFHTWQVYDLEKSRTPGRFNGMWIHPDTQKKLERDSDYA